MKVQSQGTAYRHGPQAWRGAILFGLLLCGQAGAGVIPDTGLYVEQVYRTEALSFHFNVPYSTRPNAGGQYTSWLTRKEDQSMAELTMKLDVAVPPNATAINPQPLVVWIHGGGYRAGSKEDTHDPAVTYARAGYVAAAVNYRLTPHNEDSIERRQVAVLQANEDVMNAIRYLKANAATYHIDTTRVATIGSSAGGGISLVNAVEFDTLSGAVSDYPGISSQVAAAVSTGATLVDSGYDSNEFLHYDSNDTPVLLFHANPTDSSTGATWEGNVLPTMDRINESGNTCNVVSQRDMTHTVDLSLGGNHWPFVKPFLWTRLRLGELR